MTQIDVALAGRLNELLGAVEEALDADVLALIGPIVPGAEAKTRDAIEGITGRRSKLALILHTGGGVVEVAERMVTVIRQHYREVRFIVPDLALSAGTVFVMSGDAIMMDYSSCLGPIDPQVERDNGSFVPARSYLLQYERLIDKAKANQLTAPEFAILQSFDQAELHRFAMACKLSTDLIGEWLSTYKFKDWTVTESRQLPVTPQMRRARADEIARELMDNERWGSHSRGISTRILRDDLKLEIEDLGADAEIQAVVRRYFRFALEFLQHTQGGSASAHLAHTRGFL